MSIASSAKSAAAAHILLVDDNKMGLSARKIVLEELGYKVTPFSNPAEAWDQFPQHSFDLVVTDYKMPQMNGIEFISNIRSVREALPVILISGFADTLGLDEESTGADIVIQKSNHEVANLIRAVQRLLTRKPSRKPASSQKAAAKKIQRRSI